FIPVGETEDGKVCKNDFTPRIDLDHSFDGNAWRLNDQILEAGALRLLDHGEAGTRVFARILRPSREQVIDLGLGEVGFDRQAWIAFLGQAPGELDRDGTEEISVEVATEFGGRTLIERGPFGPLAPDHAFGGKVRDINVDGVA